MKLQQLAEKNLDPQIKSRAIKAKSHEEATVGSQRFSGTKDRVEIKLKLDDPNKFKGEFMRHSHPAENPSPLSAMPSVQDLVSTINSGISIGIAGSVIYSGSYYTIIALTNKIRGDSNFSSYERASKDCDIERMFKELDKLGFETEVGII